MASSRHRRRGSKSEMKRQAGQTPHLDETVHLLAGQTNASRLRASIEQLNSIGNQMLWELSVESSMPVLTQSPASRLPQG